MQTPLIQFNSQEVSLGVENFRQEQWALYVKSYKNIFEKLNFTANQTVETLTASKLVESFLNIKNYKNFIQVNSEAQTAIISCIDEATQSGELDFVLDLEDNLVPHSNQKDVYVLDIAGSGACNYRCKNFTNKITLDEALEIDEKRLNELALRIFNWCYKKNVNEVIVSFHKNCGAVNFRCKNFPGLISNSDYILLESKKCATKLAKKIASNNNSSFSLEVKIGMITEQSMCKIRPKEMHNALGVSCNLDSNISSYKIDLLTGINFFDVLALSDFELANSYSTDKDDQTAIETIDYSVRSLKLAINLAFSSHGWGHEEYLNKDNPFLVFFMARDEYQQFQAKQIIESLKDYNNTSLKFVIVDTSK